MTDDPTLPPGSDDDVTAADARRLEALFGDLVADEPPATVTPLTVLSEARRLAHTSDPSDGRSAARSSGRTARRLRIGLLAAAVVAVLVTGTVLFIDSRTGDTSVAVGSSAAGSTAAGTNAGSAPGGSSAGGSSAAPTAGGSGTSESSAAMESSAAGATTTAAASQSGSMAPSSGSGASSAGSTSAASSGTSTASPTPSACPLTPTAPRIRAVLRGTALEGARISLCRDPATLLSDPRLLLVNLRTTSDAACVRARPSCRAVDGAPDAWTSSSTAGFRVWLYGRGYEVSVVSPDRLSGSEVDAFVEALRPVLATLP